jgi:DNA-binding Lrp family transcriptional regulator
VTKQAVAPRALDELDRQILNCLRVEPRDANTVLAARLSVTEATIAARIRALEADSVMHVCAQRDFRAAGYDVLASVDVSVSGRSLNSVANDIAALENVGIVTLVMGDPSIMLLVMTPTLDSLHDVVSRQIARIKGVRSVETMIISEILKYRSEFAALTGARP